MLTGTVKIPPENKNWGIIEPHNAKKGDPDVFFHRDVMEKQIDRLSQGQWVTFEVVPGYISKHGTLKATKVALCEPKKPRRVPEGVVPFPVAEAMHGSD